MTTRRLIPLLAGLLAVALLPAAATGQAAPVSPDGALIEADRVEDDLLQITVNRLHEEAREFFGGDYWSLSVVRLSDGHLASANGDEWHVSLSAAKAVWVAAAVAEFGPAPVERYVEGIFVDSSNGAASRVLSLWVDDPQSTANDEGVNAVNAAMWGWGLTNSYLYGWFNRNGGSYGYHLSSEWKANFPNHCCVRVWYTSNFMSTTDLARFWAMIGGGEILEPADQALFLEWARLPRFEGSGMITPRLPAAVAEQVAHKAGWNGAHTRRIDGGLVTLPSGEQFAIAISFRLHEYQTIYWNAGAKEWGRYATCEVYNQIAGTDHTCTISRDPSEIRNHTTPPIGSLSSAAATRDRVDVDGWALDVNAGAAPIDVKITVDGSQIGVLTADQLKTWVHDQQGLGNYHGFGGSLPADLSPGIHRVCAVGVNDSPAGANRTLGCRDVAVPADHLPIGTLAGVVPRADRIVAWGWAKDLDTDGPILVKVKIDGEMLRRTTADRGDGGHGWKIRPEITLDPGAYEICAYGVNYQDAGPNSLLGCTTVTIPENWPPRGVLNGARAVAGGVEVRGRAWDDDVPGTAIEVRVDIDGSEAGTVLADGGASNRRFRSTVTAVMAPGDHQVCAVALDPTGGGPSTSLGCTTVTVAAG